MKLVPFSMDGLAIGLSMLCVVHCLAAPALVVLVPAMFAGVLVDEAFHVWMLLAILPVSLVALGAGCKRHKRQRVVFYGLVGIGCLLAAVITEGWFAASELLLTLVGSCLLCLAHGINFRYCKTAAQCAQDQL